MTNSTIPILEDDAIAEIEARPAISTSPLDRRVLLRSAERDALIQTVRALKAENERLKEELFEYQPIMTSGPVKPDVLDNWLKPMCSRLMHGRCTTLYCLRRGGYTGEPADASIATCEAYESYNALSNQLDTATSMRSRCVDAIKNMHANVNGTIRKEDVIEELGSVSIQDQETRCADCAEAARLAYSDATTPGFFSPKCARHQEQEAKQ